MVRYRLSSLSKPHESLWKYRNLFIKPLRIIWNHIWKRSMTNFAQTFLFFHGGHIGFCNRCTLKILKPTAPCYFTYCNTIIWRLLETSIVLVLSDTIKHKSKALTKILNQIMWDIYWNLKDSTHCCSQYLFCWTLKYLKFPNDPNTFVFFISADHQLVPVN